MSSTTKPTLIFTAFSDATRANPAMAWMETYSKTVIGPMKWDTPYSDYHTEDFTFVRPDGVEFRGGEVAWAALAAYWGQFTAHKHDPQYANCVETEYGWEMIGEAIIYADLPGVPAEGEVKVKDRQGKGWDVRIPGGFRFQYKKEADAKDRGIKMQRTDLMSDSGPVWRILSRRGAFQHVS